MKRRDWTNSSDFVTKFNVQYPPNFGIVYPNSFDVTRISCIKYGFISEVYNINVSIQARFNLYLEKKYVNG